MSPLVSAIIPAFNAGGTIQSCIESVFRQTYSSVEVIVVDDGSKDGTSDIVSSIRNVKLIRQENRGPASARNRAIEASIGHWLAFLDADEEWCETDKLESQLLCADRFGAELVGTTGTKGRDKVIHFGQLLLGNPFVTSTVIATRGCVTAAGCFEEGRHYSEDFALWLRILAHGHKAVLAGISGSRNITGRHNYAVGGLSGNLTLMQEGEERNFRDLRDAGLMGRSRLSNAIFFRLAIGLSRLKYWRRVFVRTWRAYKEKK